MFPPEVRHFRPHSCAAGQNARAPAPLPRPSQLELCWVGGRWELLQAGGRIVFHYCLGGECVEFWFGDFWLWFLYLFFFFKPKVKPLLFRVLFSMKGEVFSVWLLRHEHIAKKCIAENRSLASHTIEVTSITKSEVLKGLWQFSLAALCEGNASFASVWQRVKTAV